MGGRRARRTLLKEQLDEQRSAARLLASCPRDAAAAAAAAPVTDPWSRTRTREGSAFKGWISASFSFCQQILQDLANVTALTGAKRWLAPPSAAGLF